ncbi:hypothetical protein [Pseudomonas serbica]|uniref:hypothetical protein n=1 Tax=Pseudomonas serbica TaxID=2965074 RepID=UPI00237B01F4|nr:hypothetical protein [Pseudomonas serbica]
MKTLNDLNRQLAGLGRLKSFLSLEFSSQWQWLALSLMLVGYVLSPSTYFHVRVMTVGAWTQFALATLLIVATGGGSFLWMRLRKTQPVVARWCCLGALCPLWMPSLFIIEGLPSLIFMGLVMGLCFMSCSLACTLAPATTTQPTHDQ